MLTIKTIEFRYNRYRGNLLQILVTGFFWIGGLILLTWLLGHALGLAIDGSPSPYWEQHREFGFAVAMLTPIIWMIVSVYPAGKLSRFLMESRGKIELCGSYAILYVKGKELRIDKKNTQLAREKFSWSMRTCYSVTSQKIHPILYIYTLYINNKKYVLIESYREGCQKTSLGQRWRTERVNLSLAEAMTAIGPFVTIYQQNDRAKQTLFIEDVSIILGVTLPDVFDNSPYYVDYDSLCRAEGVPLASCLVRERANPTHVVGDIGFSDDPPHRSELSEAILRTFPIIDGVALNEQIEV